MPTQKTITVYTFDELSEKAKEKARDKYRNNFEFEWYAEFVIDNAKTIGALFGLDIDRVFYSGFYHQGSGASFEGNYCYVKGALQAVKEYAPKDTELHGIVKALQTAQKPAFYKLRAECYTSNRGNLRVNLSHSDNDYFNVQPFEDGIESALNDFASWIYSRLQDEYEFQTSEESITEFYANNETEFTEYGDYA
jgi:hypothetical protein